MSFNTASKLFLESDLFTNLTLLRVTEVLSILWQYFILEGGLQPVAALLPKRLVFITLIRTHFEVEKVKKKKK